MNSTHAVTKPILGRPKIEVSWVIFFLLETNFEGAYLSTLGHYEDFIVLEINFLKQFIFLFSAQNTNIS